MALAQVLKNTHIVCDEVKVIDGKVESVEDKVEDVGHKVGNICKKVRGIDDKVQLVIDGAQGVHSQSPTPNLFNFRWQAGNCGGEGGKSKSPTDGNQYGRN